MIEIILEFLPLFMMSLLAFHLRACNKKLRREYQELFKSHWQTAYQKAELERQLGLLPPVPLLEDEDWCRVCEDQCCVDSQVITKTCCGCPPSVPCTKYCEYKECQLCKAVCEHEPAQEETK